MILAGAVRKVGEKVVVMTGVFLLGCFELDVIDTAADVADVAGGGEENAQCFGISVIPREDVRGEGVEAIEN